MSKKQDASSGRYRFRDVEKRMRKQWRELDLYRTGDDPQKPNVYILDFFPYPSGAGLSVGHCRNYVPTCASARFHRMKGFNVLHPMGWDAFGLPAENYAVEHGIHPRESSAEFSATYRRQMQMIECSYDWSREFSSADPSFYRWTQWFFLLLYSRDLAYRAKSSQWWCPHCQTILANEQVGNGRCWRCDSEVTRKALDQWHFRITDYAERLLDDLKDIDWPEAIKAMQRNWIGRSEGVEITFSLEADGGGDREEKEIVVFTTRPDTLYGTTFLTLAPEHPLAAAIATGDRKEAVESFIRQAARRGERERAAGVGTMGGAFTGRYALHPLTGRSIPVWVADYLLPGYGTGAIMAVPAHDGRDFAFAQEHGLPVVEVIRPLEEHDAGWCEDHGTLINSGPFDGLPSQVAGQQISDFLDARGAGTERVNYKMRDWLISRQRFWGAPIPIIYCDSCGIVPVPESELPVLLPETNAFVPTGDGQSPLAQVSDWVNVSCPDCGGPARRETDTMDGFACSSWYFLRFTSPDYEDGPFDMDAARRWMPVDTYVGGAEHAVMHLLYARFWTKVLYDAGLVPFVEPFSRLLNQGVMHSAVDGQRMSKSKGNVVTPDEVVAVHGTDALRLYILFLGPFDADVVWDERGIKGITRFLDRYWRFANQPVEGLGEFVDDPAFEQRRHQVIKQVTEDMSRYRFNTAVASLMAYLNYLTEWMETSASGTQWRTALETLTLLLCPMAPFITEEVWQNVLGHQVSVHLQAWPSFDESTVAEDTITIVIQVNGRVRERLQVERGAARDSLQDLALSSANVQRYVAGKDVRRVIVVPDRLVNVVV